MKIEMRSFCQKPLLKMLRSIKIKLKLLYLTCNCIYIIFSAYCVKLEL